MPYVKEFFAGGTNDIRAFRSRSLGPGSYHAIDTSGFYVDQPGDVKLEMNLEYRAKLFSIVRWAAFVDAGNVWTLKQDTLPGRHTRADRGQTDADAGAAPRRESVSRQTARKLQRQKIPFKREREGYRTHAVSRLGAKKHRIQHHFNIGFYAER